MSEYNETTASISAIPWPLMLVNEAVSSRTTGDNKIVLSAPGKTDLFITPDGNYRVDKSPRLVFKPDGPFILTARVKPDFNSIFDAGALVLYNDEQHFAKLCFEMDFKGVQRLVSVVCNETADDCNAIPIKEEAIYLRIIGSSLRDTFSFYSSTDAKVWFMHRSFRLAKVDNLLAGFSAQAPVGDTPCLVQFSEIKLEQREPKDYWVGD